MSSRVSISLSLALSPSTFSIRGGLLYGGLYNTDRAVSVSLRLNSNHCRVILPVLGIGVNSSATGYTPFVGSFCTATLSIILALL
jgi:hypothetical protein